MKQSGYEYHPVVTGALQWDLTATGFQVLKELARSEQYWFARSVQALPSDLLVELSRIITDLNPFVNELRPGWIALARKYNDPLAYRKQRYALDTVLERLVETTPAEVLEQIAPALCLYLSDEATGTVFNIGLRRMSLDQLYVWKGLNSPYVMELTPLKERDDLDVPFLFSLWGRMSQANFNSCWDVIYDWLAKQDDPAVCLSLLLGIKSLLVSWFDDLDTTFVKRVSVTEKYYVELVRETYPDYVDVPYEWVTSVFEPTVKELLGKGK